MIIGAQGFTIRNFAQNEADLRVTAKKLHDIGFKTLQVSAFGDIDPRIIRAVCDENDLKIIITHTNPQFILENTEQVIENHRIMGCEHVGIGMMLARGHARVFDRLRPGGRQAARRRHEAALPQPRL